MEIQKAGEIALVTIGSIAKFERVGDFAAGEFDNVSYEQIGCLSKFSQLGKCKSLRIARSILKKMRQETFA